MISVGVDVSKGKNNDKNWKKKAEGKIEICLNRQIFFVNPGCRLVEVRFFL